MIVKSDHKESFTVVSNKVLTDSSMSLRAKGLLCYLLSKPSHWEVIPKVVAKDTGESESMIRKILKELKVNGYAVLHYPKGGGSKWHIYENPEMLKTRHSQNDDFDKTRNSQNNEFDKSSDSQNSEVVHSGSSTENEAVSNEMHETTSSLKHEIHETRTIVNTDIKENTKRDNDNNNPSSSISFEDFQSKYDKKVKEDIWFMASRAWNELSPNEQLLAYQFLTDYVKLRTPKYRKHPHRYLSLREWENEELLDEIKDMKRSENQSITNQNTNRHANKVNRSRKSRFTTSRPN